MRRMNGVEIWCSYSVLVRVMVIALVISGIVAASQKSDEYAPFIAADRASLAEFLGLEQLGSGLVTPGQFPGSER